MSRPRSWHAWPAFVVGLGLIALCVAAAGLAGAGHAPHDFGVLQSPDPAAAATGPAGQQALAAPDQPRAGDRVVPALPVSLAIPSLRVRAPVEQVATTDAILAVPEDPADVGWWVGSALPGTASGTVVIDGHVDSAAAGPGALFRLTELRAGDEVLLTTARHRQLRYVVAARRVLDKSKPLPADLFARTGPARLVLITCGGPFDQKSLSYQDNIVVVALPSS